MGNENMLQQQTGNAQHFRYSLQPAARRDVSPILLNWVGSRDLTLDWATLRYAPLSSVSWQPSYAFESREAIAKLNKK